MSSTTSNRPNILFVFADEWRRQAMGCMNEDPVLTPNMDRFAAESMLFRNAISPQPVCTPHRASLMTGQYPYTCQMTTNCRPGRFHSIQPNGHAIGNELQRAGYRTGYIGKWHLDNPSVNRTPRPNDGADHWDAYTPPGDKRLGFEFWHSYGCWDVHNAPHYWHDTPEMIQIDKWSPEHETDVAIDYLQNRTPETPFCLFVSWNPPHMPFEQVPERYKKLYADMDIPWRPNVCEEGKQLAQDHIRNYYAAISGLDDQFGRLLECLDAEGLRENTVVVLSSDHGEMMGSHGRMYKNTWHEESFGIPFVVRYPGVVEAKETNALLSGIDIMPTLLGLSGLPIPETVQGKDCSPVLRNETHNVQDCVFGTAYFLSLPHESWPKPDNPAMNQHAIGWRCARTETHSLVINTMNGCDYDYLLYDLENDPYQTDAVEMQDPTEHPIAADMLTRLIAELDRIDDPFVIPGCRMPAHAFAAPPA